MKFTEHRPQGVTLISACDAQSLTLAGHTWQHSLILSPDTAPTAWPPQSFAELTAEHFAALLAYAPEVVLLGTGRTLHFPAPALYRSLIEAGIGVECMASRQAALTYNFLATDGRRVLGALLLGDEA